MPTLSEEIPPKRLRRNRRHLRSSIVLLGHSVSVRGLIWRCLEGCLLLLMVVGATGGQVEQDPSLMLKAGLFVVASLGALQAFSMYERHRVPKLVTLGRLLVVYLGVGAVMLAAGRLSHTFDIPSWMLAKTLLFGATGSFVFRLLSPWLFRLLLPPVPVLVVGTGSLAEEVATILRGAGPHGGILFIGTHDPLNGDRALGDIIQESCVGEIIVASSEQRGMPIADLLQCKLKGIVVTDYVSFMEREKRYLPVDAMRPSWMIFGGGFAQGPWRTIVKRLLDIVLSGAILLITAPIVLLAALVIYAETGRPVLYRQIRLGQDGREITIMKLRSMRQDAEKSGVPQWAAERDPRVTRVGHVIRATRIDEIPQLLSVLKGDMSFVGPRPERPYFAEKLRDEIPYYDLRHVIKPGLTGWAQVNYPYGSSIDDARAKLRYDLYYIKNHSLLLDLLIVASTIRVVLFRQGAR